MTWLVTYELDGATYHYEIPAQTQDEAERHVEAIRHSSVAEGEVYYIAYQDAAVRLS